MNRPDRHNEIELDLLKNASITYLLGDEPVTISQGNLGAFWAAIPHQIVASSRDPDTTSSPGRSRGFCNACNESGMMVSCLLLAMAAIAVACGGWTMLRTNGISGAGAADFEWRWSENPEERLPAETGGEAAIRCSDPAGRRA